MRSPNTTAIVLASLLLFAPTASAHRLVSNDGSHISAETALYIEDIDLSQVVYHVLGEETAELWITFHGSAGQSLYSQIGIPVIQGLETYRPALLWVGPGLPAVNTPLVIPEGLGGIVLDTDEVTPTFFEEHFTGTDSWILREDERPLPETGQYYLVAYHPEGMPGKLWISVGRREEFGLRDLLTYPETLSVVRQFHEVHDERLPILPMVMLTLSRLIRLLFFQYCF